VTAGLVASGLVLALLLPSAACAQAIDLDSLDAIVYPTGARSPARITVPSESHGGLSAIVTNVANLTGFHDLIVPGGFTSDRLPQGISFVGPAFSGPRLLALCGAFEQATKARRRPAHTPALPGETVPVKWDRDAQPYKAGAGQDGCGARWEALCLTGASRWTSSSPIF